MIEVENPIKRYGDKVAVEDVASRCDRVQSPVFSVSTGYASPRPER